MKDTFSQKNMKLLLLLAPVFAILAISGCTTGGNTATGNGVTILNWEPTHPSVESEEQVQLRLKIQNKGGEVAEDVTARLFNINLDEWNAEPFDGEIDFGDLMPPNPRYNTEGDIGQETFDLEAPLLPEGLTKPFEPRVRVFYHYRTTAYKPITLVNENELLRLRDRGESLPSGATSTSAGPLTVDVQTGDLIRAKEGFTRNVFPITIIIRNTGGGVVSTIDTPEDDYLVNVDLELPDSLSVEECGGFAPGEDIELWKGQDTSLTCKLNIDQVPFASQDENLIIRLEYDYYIDSLTTISVKGTEEAGGFFP